MTRAKLSQLKANLSDLNDLNLSVMPTGNYLVFRNEAGDIMFTVNEDDLFDADGNRFENDLP
jgi:hypothetical protein